MTAPHTILFPFVGGDVVGGSHQSAVKLIASLDPGRFRARIVLHGGAGQLARLIEDHGLAWDRMDRPGIVAPRFSRGQGDVSAWRYVLGSIPALARRLRDWRIDLVHTNDGRMHGTWAVPARLAGCRLVWHHRQDPAAFGVNVMAPLLAHQIITVSEFARPSRPVRRIDDRCRVIHSPFDLIAQRPDRADAAHMLRRAIDAAPGAVVLGYVGTLNQRKRPGHFVRAIAHLHRALPGHDIHGVMLGKPKRADDPVADDCARLAADLGIADRLHLMGHVAPVQPWLAGMDALLVTALDEPFGRTLIEAMDLGTPVIATRHGGNPEAISDNHTGFLVDPHDPRAFEAPLRRLLDDPGLRDRITAAAGTGLDRFGTDAHRDRVQAVYGALLDRPPRITGSRHG